jgi:hypothetical protein
MFVVVQEERTSRATVDAQARRSDFMEVPSFSIPPGHPVGVVWIFRES